MNSLTAVDYIKQNYPQVVFNPLKIKNASKALGFVISNNQLVMGYITKDGSLCKFSNPIDITKIDNKSFVEILKKIPEVVGFDSSNKQSIINIVASHGKEQTDQERQNIIKELSDRIKSEKDAEYKVIIDNLKLSCIGGIDPESLDVYGNQLVLLKQQHSAEIDDLRKIYQDEIVKLKDSQEICKQKILSEKQYIINAIVNFKKNISEYIESRNLSTQKELDHVNGLYNQILKEKKEIEMSMESVKTKEQENLKLLKENEIDASEKLQTKEKEISKLDSSIKDIQNELEILKQKYSKVEIENIALNEFKKKCINKIINEKEEIIKSIKEYNKQWIEWVEENDLNIEEYKEMIKRDLNRIFNNLKQVLKDTRDSDLIKELQLSNSEKSKLIKQLENNAKEIKAEVQKALSEQFLELSELKNNEKSAGTDTLKIDESVLLEKNKEIDELRGELQKVKDALANNNKVVLNNIDYDNCKIKIKNFAKHSNMMVRKLKIIESLDKIFEQKNQELNKDIYKNYQIVREEILKVNSLFENVKNNTKIYDYIVSDTQPPQVCNDLDNFFNEFNINEFRNYDKQLANFYEDIGGSVRVYVKIKPLIKEGQKMATRTIKESNNEKNVIVNCDKSLKKTQEYGEFYRIFNDNYLNLDVYTGVLGSKDYIDKSDPNELKINMDQLISEKGIGDSGLHGVFSQVEDGYSIVIFGYGLSGSGKTASLLGFDNDGKHQPGLLHYGLANLKNVKQISLYKLFEQYVDIKGSIRSTTINKNVRNRINGKVINLVGTLPIPKIIQVDERVFEKQLESRMDYNNIKVNQISELTNLINNYRIKNRRIKETPNNIESSRSHLYMVFQVEFDNGTKGYITIVDTAGRESPKEISNLFLTRDNNYRFFGLNVKNESDAISQIEKLKRPGNVKKNGKEYDGRDIYEIIKEGFYINETINHLIYYFKRKVNKKTCVNGFEDPGCIKINKLQDISEYSDDKYFIDPKLEYEKEYENESRYIYTIPILRYLDNCLGNDNNKCLYNDDTTKPTKFITLVSVRQEEEKCEQIFSSMDFAQNVKST